ncbi:MAG: hypothetical protein J6Y72_01380 [Bacteroidales bacterium]|nr:hypothetical protein [Bacteroidales bacterium]
MAKKLDINVTNDVNVSPTNEEGKERMYMPWFNIGKKDYYCRDLEAHEKIKAITDKEEITACEISSVEPDLDYMKVQGLYLFVNVSTEELAGRYIPRWNKSDETGSGRCLCIPPQGYALVLIKDDFSYIISTSFSLYNFASILNESSCTSHPYTDGDGNKVSHVYYIEDVIDDIIFDDKKYALKYECGEQLTVYNGLNEAITIVHKDAPTTPIAVIPPRKVALFIQTGDLNRSFAVYVNGVVSDSSKDFKSRIESLESSVQSLGRDGIDKSEYEDYKSRVDSLESSILGNDGIDKSEYEDYKSRVDSLEGSVQNLGNDGIDKSEYEDYKSRVDSLEGSVQNLENGGIDKSEYEDYKSRVDCMKDSVQYLEQNLQCLILGDFQHEYEDYKSRVDSLESKVNGGNSSEKPDIKFTFTISNASQKAILCSDNVENLDLGKIWENSHIVDVSINDIKKGDIIEIRSGSSQLWDNGRVIEFQHSNGNNVLLPFYETTYLICTESEGNLCFSPYKINNTICIKTDYSPQYTILQPLGVADEDNRNKIDLTSVAYSFTPEITRLMIYNGLSHEDVLMRFGSDCEDLYVSIPFGTMQEFMLHSYESIVPLNVGKCVTDNE